MLEAWSTGILQVCHTIDAVVLAGVLELAACWPLFVVWSTTSKLALLKPAQVLFVEASWQHCCSHLRCSCEC
jgi:hypothetical protein